MTLVGPFHLGMLYDSLIKKPNKQNNNKNKTKKKNKEHKAQRDSYLPFSVTQNVTL